MLRMTWRTSVIWLAIGLASCSSERKSDGEQIVDALGRLLASGGTAVCINSGTRGGALDVWRDASRIVQGTKGASGWSGPARLVPPAKVERTVVVAGKAQTQIIEPGAAPDALPKPLAQRIDIAARRLALADPGDSISVGDAPGISSRWWPLHRLARTCAYSYQFSTPTQLGSIAFVAVDANHWGTVYALEKREGTWQPIARWAPWLY